MQLDYQSLHIHNPVDGRGVPYGELIRYGQKFLDEDIFSVPILSGFAFGDTPKNGISVNVHSRSITENTKFVAAN